MEFIAHKRSIHALHYKSEDNLERNSNDINKGKKLNRRWTLFLLGGVNIIDDYVKYHTNLLKCCSSLNLPGTGAWDFLRQLNIEANYHQQICGQFT